MVAHGVSRWERAEECRAPERGVRSSSQRSSAPFRGSEGSNPVPTAYAVGYSLTPYGRAALASRNRYARILASSLKSNGPTHFNF